MIKIDKNVPIPPYRKGERRYPWNDMEVGDSFFAPDVKPINFARSSYAASRGNGHKYRVVPERNGARAFRIT